MNICYLEDELCVSDNLEDPRGTDEESELSSILNPPYAPQPALSTVKSLPIVQMEDRSISIILLRWQNDARIG
jgi:hypothetical protein